MRLRWIGLTVLAVVLNGSANAQAPGPAAEPSGPWREQTHWVPTGPANGPPLLHARICRPQHERPARVVLINHGKPTDANVPNVKPASCTNEAVQWFLARGYLVVLGVRRGYGESRGDLAETSRSCSAADLVRAAQEGASDVAALVRYATVLPYAQREHVVVVGQSVGGWVTVGYDSLPHPQVTAMVSMAGGHGGHVHDIPNNTCRPDQLIIASGMLGQTATTPMLWVYAENDSYFGPALAKSMHEAFVAAGGRAELHQLPAFGKDGHSLFFGTGGSAIWGPLMENYLGR